MIRRLASGITDYFVKNNIVEESEHELYTYGFDLIISGFMNVTLVIIAGIIIGKRWEAFMYVCIMISVRMYTGGYHADTHFMCNIIFLSTFLFSVLIMKLMDSVLVLCSIWILQCIGLIIVARYTPVENKNKKLNAEQKEKYRIIGMVLYLTYIIVSVVLYAMNLTVINGKYFSLYERGLYINTVLIIIAGLLIIGKRKEGRSFAKEDFEGNSCSCEKDSSSCR